jgi:hypothetical protein
MLFCINGRYCVALHVLFVHVDADPPSSVHSSRFQRLSRAAIMSTRVAVDLAMVSITLLANLV